MITDLHAHSWAVHRVTLGATGTTTFSSYMPADSSSRFFANGLYLKNFHNDSRKTSVSNTEGNWLRRCLKHNESLWFPQPTQIKWGIVLFRYHFNPPLSPELTLVVSMHANRALVKSTDWSWKSSSKYFIMLAAESDVPTTLLKG